MVYCDNRFMLLLINVSVLVQSALAQTGGATSCQNIPNRSKQACGFNLGFGSSAESNCLQQGCCWDSSPGSFSFTPWCFQPSSSSQTTTSASDPFPTSTTTFSSLPTTTSARSTTAKSTLTPVTISASPLPSFIPPPSLPSPPTSSSSASNNDGADNGGMSLGAKIGIILGSIIGVLLLVALVAYLYNKRKHREEFSKIDLSLHRPPSTGPKPVPAVAIAGAAGIAARSSSARPKSFRGAIPPPPHLYNNQPRQNMQNEATPQQVQQQPYEYYRNYPMVVEEAGPSNQTVLSTDSYHSPGGYYTVYQSPTIAQDQQELASPTSSGSVATPIAEQFMQQGGGGGQPQNLTYESPTAAPPSTKVAPVVNDRLGERILQQSERILDGQHEQQGFLTPVYVNGVFIGYSNQLNQFQPTQQ